MILQPLCNICIIVTQGRTYFRFRHSKSHLCCLNNKKLSEAIYCSTFKTLVSFLILCSHSEDSLLIVDIAFVRISPKSATTITFIKSESSSQVSTLTDYKTRKRTLNKTRTTFLKVHSQSKIQSVHTIIQLIHIVTRGFHGKPK